MHKCTFPTYALVLSLMLGLPVVAQTTVPNASQTAPALTEVRRIDAVTEYALPNGLQVLLVPDATKPVATVNITYRVGSRHEGVGETGAAHLLEHMLFKASGKVQNPALDMTALGMRWNGTTNADRTNYFAHFLTSDDKAAERIDYMLQWLAGMVHEAKFTRADLDSEMTVVRNEFERAENEPIRVLQDRMRGLAFGVQGYGHSTLGLKSDIENMPLTTLYAFYRKHYRPDNATLILAGRFDEALVKTRIAQTLGLLPKPDAPLPVVYSTNPAQDGERSVTLRRAGGLGATAVLYPMPAGGSREGAAVRVLAEALQQRGGPMSRGLTATQLAVTEWAYFGATREPGYLMAGVGLPEFKPEEAEVKANASSAALAKVVETVALTDAEIKTAKASLTQGMRATLRDAESTGQALSGMVAMGDWRLLFALLQWTEEITPDEVRALARQYLLPTNRTSGTFLPLPNAASAPARAPVPQITDTTKLIAAYARPLSAKGINHAEDGASSGTGKPVQADSFEITPQSLAQRVVRHPLDVGGAPGLKLAVLPRASKDDRVVGALRLRWGTTESVKGSGVLATMIAPLLTEGTGKQSGTQIKERMQALDARIGFSSSAGFLSASLEFPARHTAAVLELLTQLLREASFADADFDRNQRAMIANMQSIKASTASVAGNVLERSYRAYAEGDPREARTHAQTEAQMRSATAQQLRDYWKRFGSASVGELSLIGPVNATSVRTQLQTLWGDWAAREPHVPWTIQHAAAQGDKRSVIGLPDRANASYAARLGFAMNERNADYPALFASVQLLSRLGLLARVREKDGLSYGVEANLSAPWEGDAAAIYISASFAPQNRDKLLTAVREVLLERREQGFGGLEVSFAKSAIVSRRAEWLAQPINAAGNMAFNLRYDRALDSYAQTTKSYEDLDSGKVNAALKKYLKVDDLVEALAGSFSD